MTTEPPSSSDWMTAGLKEALSVAADEIWRPDPSRFSNGCAVRACADSGNHLVAVVEGPDGTEGLEDYAARLGRTAALLRQALLDVGLHRLLVLFVWLESDVHQVRELQDWLLDPRVRRSDEVVRLLPVGQRKDEVRWRDEVQTVAAFSRKEHLDPASVAELLWALEESWPVELSDSCRRRLISDLTRMLASDVEPEPTFSEVIEWLDSLEAAGKRER